MDLVRCVDCKHFAPDPASLRTGKCLHQQPWDGSEMQFARDEHHCATFDSLGGKRHLTPEEEEKLKKFPAW